MSRSRDLADLGGDATGLETLTVSDITDLTATATELNYTDGVSSALQTQINAKAGTGANAPSGSVIKVQSVTYTGHGTISAGSIATVGGTDTGNLTITTGAPASSSSKFLLMAHITHSISSSHVITFYFYDGSSVISSAISDAGSFSNRLRGSFGPGHWSTGPSSYPTNVSSMNHLYAPSSSSSMTLTVKGGIDTGTHYYNRSVDSSDVDWLSNSISSFTVMEIAG